jgi:hypothetical protein
MWRKRARTWNGRSNSRRERTTSYYALALAQALGGRPGGAHENLKRAIELEPRNRIMARQDADFAPLAKQPPFDALLYPEKKGW